ncbi:MAG: hypothetical protein MK110_10180 [Fuerstiella sp.]|nr:hypothetical protein [Fuerstiella sp.]
MNDRRRQVLLGVLLLIGGACAGDYFWYEKVEKPLDELRLEYTGLLEKFEKRTRTLKRAKELRRKVSHWKKQALPARTETARSLYRNWLLETIRTSKLRNARVDSGTPLSNAGFKIVPINAQARGTLSQITDALFTFENTALLHRIDSIRLTPIGKSGQFDLAMSIEAVMMPGIKRKILKPAHTQRLVSPDRRSYDIVARDNIFGVDVDLRDPMKMTKLTGVIWRNDVPQVWITEQIGNRLHKLRAGATFDTTALSGRIVEIGEDWTIVESGNQQLKLTMGQSFADAETVSTR